jgi:hypothetical protein
MKVMKTSKQENQTVIFKGAKTMTNQERQKSLDKQKWYRSQEYGEDLSGKMTYCTRCDKMNCMHKCTATQKEREEQTLCAKAYNRTQRHITKGATK